jgi:serine protease Do
MRPLNAMLLGGALSCLLVGLGVFIGSRSTGQPMDPVQQIGGVGSYSGVNAVSGNAIVEAVKRVGPAVMNVDTKFGRGGTQEFLPSPGGMGPREGKGTGVVIDSKKGLMLTNAHVVQGAERIQVTTRDGKKYSGRLVGSDRFSDIALVELSNKKLPQARLAAYTDPKALAIGEWAIAIGNPFAQENTVTVGVISAVGRQVGPAPLPGGRPGETIRLTDMIQTDAAINPGNSGGPLCNIRGEVIGINTAIIPFATGLGFTIPISRAKTVALMLLRNSGKVPYIGIRMLTVDAEVQKEFSVAEKKGVFVQDVVKGSPADSAGLRAGDVIRAIDGKAVDTSEAAQAGVQSKKIGETVKIEIVRGKARRTLSMKLAPRPD